MIKTGYVYILTNKNKTVLYVGVTNNLKRRLKEHMQEPKGFVKKYNAQFLLYFESIQGIRKAIDREKQIKKWRRIKKEVLITSVNPNWNFLNEEIL
ncbi:MAG: putative endonuclease [Patiriisocius sp.]|jgi:putative endonuclease